jgi:nucleoid-associated protein YgaU
MTRETKIGLLVGLAFIIVIGILLSDHWNSSNEPPQAQRDDIGQNVRIAMGTPATPEPPVTNLSGAGAVLPPATASRKVLTRNELKPPVDPAPVTDVNVGPAGGGIRVSPHVTIPAPPAVVVEARPAAPVQPQPLPFTPEPGPVVSQPPADTGVPPTLQDVARQNGQELVPANPDGNNANPPPAADTQTTPGYKRYKAQPGDSLSRIASRLMGRNTKTNRDAIIRANPALQQNPDKVIVGREYLIPVNAAGAVAVAVTPRTPPAPAAPPAPRRDADRSETRKWEELVPMEPVTERAPAAQPQRVYTVKSGENLWKIAASQLGDGNAWTLIRDLNQDVLKGGDTVKPDMRLRLPAKPVAAAD